jgi:hypothetical protein
LKVDWLPWGLMGERQLVLSTVKLFITYLKCLFAFVMDQVLNDFSGCLVDFHVLFNVWNKMVLSRIEIII